MTADSNKIYLSAVVVSTIATNSMSSAWNYSPFCGSFIQTPDCTLPGTMVVAAGELNDHYCHKILKLHLSCQAFQHHSNFL